jgi:hypothetical protein
VAWRFEGKRPFEAFHDRPPREGEPMWPSREQALVQAFTIEAGLRERDGNTLLRAIASAFSR